MIFIISLLWACVWSADEECGHYKLSGPDFDAAASWDTCHPSWRGNRTHGETIYLINTCNETDNTGSVWMSDNIMCTDRTLIAGPFSINNESMSGPFAGNAELDIDYIECGSSIGKNCFAYGIRRFNDESTCKLDEPTGRDVDPYLSGYCIDLWSESRIYNCTDQSVSIYSDLECNVADFVRKTSFETWETECQINLVPFKGGYVQETVICGWEGVLEEWATLFGTTTEEPESARSHQIFFGLFISVFFVLNN